MDAGLSLLQEQKATQFPTDNCNDNLHTIPTEWGVFIGKSSTRTEGLRKSHFGTTIDLMRIIALSTLKAFWEEHPEYMDAKEPILAWYRHALAADWSAPAYIKQDFRNASILKDGRAVFNIAGNKYRLIVWINFAYRVVYIRFIGTHAQYDQIDVQTI